MKVTNCILMFSYWADMCVLLWAEKSISPSHRITLLSQPTADGWPTRDCNLCTKMPSVYTLEGGSGGEAHHHPPLQIICLKQPRLGMLPPYPVPRWYDSSGVQAPEGATGQPESWDRAGAGGWEWPEALRAGRVPTWGRWVEMGPLCGPKCSATSSTVAWDFILKMQIQRKKWTISRWQPQKLNPRHRNRGSMGLCEALVACSWSWPCLEMC